MWWVNMRLPYTDGAYTAFTGSAYTSKSYTMRPYTKLRNWTRFIGPCTRVYEIAYMKCVYRAEHIRKIVIWRERIRTCASGLKQGAPATKRIGIAQSASCVRLHRFCDPPPLAGGKGGGWSCVSARRSWAQFQLHACDSCRALSIAFVTPPRLRGGKGGVVMCCCSSQLSAISTARM